jgi:hypothetical protein
VEKLSLLMISSAFLSYDDKGIALVSFCDHGLVYG